MTEQVKNEILELEINSILSFIQEGIHITDQDGITLRFNPACEKIDHISANEVIGKDMSTLVEQGIYSKSVALETIKKKKKVSLVQKVNNKDIFATGTPIFYKGELIRVLVNTKDMTELNKLKGKLKISQIDLDKCGKEILLLRNAQNREPDFIYSGKEMDRIVDLCHHIATVDSTVLIQGESGTGKEVLSRFIHRISHRKDYPFIKIDCGSIPETLLESELFGYDRGAFTGASREGKIGLVELAHKGTLFLDEIGDMSLNLQIKLLRLIQDREFIRVGSHKVSSVDIRIIAATNKDLKQMVKTACFREDLYYRLNVISINMPPLCKRREDIPFLINFFCERFNEKYKMNKSFSLEAINRMMLYNWPGNVRELQNVIERLIVTTRNEVLSGEDIVNIGDLMVDEKVCLDNDWANSSLKGKVTWFEIQLIHDAISKSNSVKQLSELTGTDISTLRKKCERYGIDLDFSHKVE